jgi:hypothetical protein
MTTRTTLRLGGLAAAIVLSLALVSSASARPAGWGYTRSVAATSQSSHGSGVQLHRSGVWVQHNRGASLTAVAPLGPADRHGGLITVVPITPVTPAESSGFAWTDAAIGALFGLGLAIIAGYAAVTIRGRRSNLALQ